jgi:hypothetical protein
MAMPNTYLAENQAVVTSKTLAGTDCGTIQVVAVDAQTFTLPAVAAANAGQHFIIVNGATNNGDIGFTLATNAADSLNGLGFTAANGKGAILTKATSRPGDYIIVCSSGSAGAGGWSVLRCAGTFTRVP